MNKKLKLWVDDERVEPEGWIRATTGENAIRLLETYAGSITELALDHDLDDCVDTRRGYAELTPLTGYDVICWLEEKAQCGEWHIVPRQITCHSGNPSGRARIMQAIDSIQRLWKKNLVDEMPFSGPGYGTMTRYAVLHPDRIRNEEEKR